MNVRVLYINSATDNVPCLAVTQFRVCRKLSVIKIFVVSCLLTEQCYRKCHPSVLTQLRECRSVVFTLSHILIMY